MRRPQVLVGKPPPSLGHPESDVEPPEGPRCLDDSEETLRNQQPLEVPQGIAQAAGRVEHVDGENQVELLKGDPLGLRIALDVQELVADERVSLEPLGGALGECRGHIGEYVLAAVCRQDGENRGRGSARARAHFEQLQHTPLRRPRDGRADDLLHETVEGTSSRRVLVEPLCGGHGSTGEQERQRIGVSPQHLRQPLPAAAGDAHLAGGPGMPVHQLRAARLGVNCRWDAAHLPYPVHAAEDSILLEHPQHASEKALMTLDHAQIRRQRSRGHPRAETEIPSQLMEGVHDV